MPSWAPPRRSGALVGISVELTWTVECEIFRIRLNNSMI
jgi:hypothetical protein